MRTQEFLAVPCIGVLAIAALICLGMGLAQLGQAGTDPYLLILAGLAGFGLALWLPRRAGLDARFREPDTLFWAGLGLGLLLYAGLALFQESALIQGTRYFWLEDDAMVSMRYAARLAAGQGLTWTEGPRVEGYSNFLWTLLMALVHWAGAPLSQASAWILAANALGLAWLALAVRRLSAALEAPPLAAALAGLACAFSFDCVGGALTGLEMVAVAAVTAEALAQGAAADREAKDWPWTAFALAGFLPLLRADGALAAGLILLLGLRRSGHRGMGLAALACALALGPAAAHELFRHAYYGQWEPNTLVLKGDFWPGKYGEGAWKLGIGLLRYPLAALALLACAWIRAFRPYLLFLLALAFYCAWSGADYYPFLRFFASGLPVCFALAFAGLGRLPWRRWRGPLAALLLLCSTNAALAFPRLLQGGWELAQERLRVSLELARTIPKQESLASCWAGSFFYFSGLPGVDLLGKCDAVVARAKVDPSLGGIGHNKMDLDHSLGALRPDWVLIQVPSYSQPDEAYLIPAYDHRLAQDPRFKTYCLPQIRQVSDHWAVCHCLWPALKDKKAAQ
jgi:hypothetical protein